MRDKCKLLLALLLLLGVGGCAQPSWTTAGKILPPAYEVCPLEGKWSVTEEMGAANDSAPAGAEAADDFLQFSRQAVILGSNVWNRPTFKIKKVDSRDYLMTRNIVFDNDLTSAGPQAEVVTVFADGNYLGEFMKINAASAIAFVQNKVLLLHKISDQADDPRTIANASIDDPQYNQTGASGVFIGLRIPSGEDYVYQTLWVAADDKKLHPLLCRDHIYFPRRSGFWELQVQPGDAGTALAAHNLAEKNSAMDKGGGFASVSASAASAAARDIIIDYIGNDYAAIENNIGGHAQFQMVPVDKLAARIGIKAVDLLGEAGVKAYRSAWEQALQSLYRQGMIPLDEDMEQDNLGLTRRNGHWHLQGRLNYQKDGAPAALDFDINLLPPANLVFYDTLYPSWQSIKDRVPNALDAVTSPNKDIAVVKTKSRLYVFSINGEQLSSVPLGEIPLPEGTTIIMAEWATGFYVDDWEKNFSANGASEWKK